MRTIKFRGKSLIAGKWLYGSHFNDGAEDYILSNLPSGTVDYESYQVDQNTVGQYTGIRDANGKEIYEGDILKEPHSDITCAVAWYKDHFTLADEDGKTIGGILPYFSRFAIVVGNIYDNPELLNK